MRMPYDVIRGKSIAFVSNNTWSVYNFRIDVIRYLLQAGASVTVIAPADDYAVRLEQEGCEFIDIDLNNKSENPLADLLFYRRLKNLYGRLKPDFIFHYVAKPNIYGSLAARANRIPSVAVITGLGYPFARKDLLFYIMRFLYRIALKKVHQVWFLNKEDAEVFSDEGITGGAPVKILPGEGVNTQHFNPSHLKPAGSNSFHFLMSCRLLKSKGIAIYAEAARIIRSRKHLDATFGLIGFFEKNHPDSISQHDLMHWQQEGLIDYYGFVDDVRPYLSVADCVVFPSNYNEGVPRCLMEAASMEIPAITTAARGCREVVLNEENGFLTRVNDPHDLADKMEKMMNLNSDARRTMGRRGRELVIQKFEVGKITQVYANTLISAFENKHGSNS